MYTGITSAFFRIFGKVPSSNALFIMFEITGTIWKEACFSNLAGILDSSKYSLTLNKLLQKVSQLIPVGASVLYNILKVYQSWTPEKVFFFKMASKMAAETS